MANREKNSQRGIALVIVLIVSAILLSLIGGALLFSGLNLKASGNLKTGAGALHAADAGIEHAIAVIPAAGDFNSLLAGSDPNFPLNSGKPTLTGSLAGHTYSVVVENDTNVSGETATYDNNQVVILTSTATGPNNSLRRVKAYVSRKVDAHELAMISNGSPDISADLKVGGTCGLVHFNGAMTISGNPGVENADGFTSSGSMTISGSPCVGHKSCDTDDPNPDYVLDTTAEKTSYANAHQNQAQKALQAINPADFAPRVAAMESDGYIFHNDGTVTQGGSCGSDGLCSGGTAVPIPSGWTWDGTRWKTNSNFVANGLFYFETPVRVSHNPGTPKDPWQATIIARDSIDFGGNPKVKPYPTTDNQLKNIYMVSGNDIKINADVGVSGTSGAVLAHQQLILSGSPKIYGSLLIGDGQPTWSGDPFPTNTSGENLGNATSLSTATITLNCGQPVCKHPACGSPKVNMAGWHEVM